MCRVVVDTQTFYGRNNLRSLEEVKKWLLQLAGELTERLQADARDNSRLPQLLTVSFQSSSAASDHSNTKRAAPAKGDPNRWSVRPTLPACLPAALPCGRCVMDAAYLSSHPVSAGRPASRCRGPMRCT